MLFLLHCLIMVMTVFLRHSFFFSTRYQFHPVSFWSNMGEIVEYVICCNIQSFVQIMETIHFLCWYIRKLKKWMVSSMYYVSLYLEICLELEEYIVLRHIFTAFHASCCIKCCLSSLIRIDFLKRLNSCIDLLRFRLEYSFLVSTLSVYLASDFQRPFEDFAPVFMLS